MVKLVVDAMGGDHAPQAIVAGVVDAVNKYEVGVTLVGLADQVRLELKRHKYDESRIEVVHADEVVEMGESPAAAIRKKKNSSIMVGVNLVKEGKAQAFFSAGNTGGVVCAA